MRSKQTSQLHTPFFRQWVRSEIDDKAKLPFLLNELTVCIKALVSSVITHTARTVYRGSPTYESVPCRSGRKSTFLQV
jgi:hypothetical protein